MKKLMIMLLLNTIVLTTIVGCATKVPKEFDWSQLTRVDVQIFTEENNDNEIIIAEEEKIKSLREVFAKIKWEENVKAEMDRKEDVNATLFFTFDKNMPERLFEYFIWFNHDDISTTIIDKEKNALETLNKDDTKTLKDIVLHN
ncbi:hypothetical protein K0H71_12000 [Bacillus sp. IITD106]|nr:hypothetical protein [Bacillus sp. IITD106]